MREIVVQSQITEKSSDNLAQNKYTFFVLLDANKIEIKQFVEKRFGVHVDKVNIVTVKPKKRRRGKITGKTKQRKKAIVTIKAGETIEAMKEIF